MYPTFVEPKAIPWWQRIALSFLPTYRSSDGSSSLDYKRWKGKIYIVGEHIQGR